MIDSVYCASKLNNSELLCSEKDMNLNQMQFLNEIESVPLLSFGFRNVD